MKVKATGNIYLAITNVSERFILVRGMVNPQEVIRAPREWALFRFGPRKGRASPVPWIKGPSWASRHLPSGINQ